MLLPISKRKQYVPIDSQIPENRIFGQYHTEHTSEMKTQIFKELSKENPKIWLILATIALGIGLNAPNNIHCRPPTTNEKYFQEIDMCGSSPKSVVGVGSLLRLQCTTTTMICLKIGRVWLRKSLIYVGKNHVFECSFLIILVLQN